MFRPTKYIIALFLFYGCVTYAKAEEMFNWQDCVREAARNNPDVISGFEAVKESEADKRIAASSIFPQIDSSLSVTTAKSGSTTTDTYSYGVDLTQLLFDGAKTSADIKAAAENIKASKFNYSFTSSEVRFSLRSAFINLLRAQELLNISEDIFNIRRSNLELITLRYESGLEHRGALLNAEANLAGAQAELAQAERNLEVAQRQLSKEMGRLEFLPLTVNGDFEVNLKETEKPDFEILAELHPSLGRLIAQRNSAVFGISSARAEFFPKLSASAGADKTGSRWPADADRWNAGLSLSFPLFEGGLKLARIDKAKAVYNQAQENERSAKDDIVLTLHDSWSGLLDAIENAEVANKFLGAAEERSRIAESQYSLGMIGFDDWTIIEDNLVSAKKTLLDARANALLAEARWVSAKGETLEYAQE